MKKPAAITATQVANQAARAGVRASNTVSKSSSERIRSRLFKEQIAFIDDPNQFKSLLCPRRSGKTFAVAAALMLCALAAPNAAAAFVAVTKTHAKRIIWRELLAMNTKFSVGAKPNRVEHILDLPNGSVISLHGAETEHDIEKFRGVAFDLVVFDEAASMPDVLLDYMVQEVLPYTLLDKLGTLVLAGTPGAILRGDFYKATAPESCQVEDYDGERRVRALPFPRRAEPAFQGVAFEWMAHGWTMRENVGLGVNPETGVSVIWERALADKKRRNLSDDDPRWIREGLGRWVADDTGFVFRYLEGRNGWTPAPVKDSPWGLPAEHEWFFAAGVDLGHDDDFDIEVFAFSDTCPFFFHIYGYAKPGLNVTECAAEMLRVNKMFGEKLVFVCDPGGLGKQILLEFSTVYGLHIEPAKKQDKRDYIEIVNGDLLSSRMFVIKDSNLARQMEIAQWNEKRTLVDERFADHAIDAAIYVRRYALHHFARPIDQGLKEGTAEWHREQSRAARSAICERRAREAEGEWFDTIKTDQSYPELDEGRWFQ